MYVIIIAIYMPCVNDKNLDSFPLQQVSIAVDE